MLIKYWSNFQKESVELESIVFDLLPFFSCTYYSDKVLLMCLTIYFMHSFKLCIALTTLFMNSLLSCVFRITVLCLILNKVGIIEPFNWLYIYVVHGNLRDNH